MGIRAHLITEYRDETFSLGEDGIWDILELEDGPMGEVSIHIDESGCGMISMSLNMAIKISKSKEVEKDTRSRLIEDIKWALEHDENWLKYYCY